MYDDEGNAHIVTAADVNGEEEVREVHGDLVEPDQWINKDPSQPKIDWKNMQVEAVRPQKTGLARFARKGHSSATTAMVGDEDLREDGGWGRSRRYSTDSAASSLATPEEATRSTFGTYGTGSISSSDPWAKDTTPTATAPPPRRRSREDDIFSHEF